MDSKFNTGVPIDSSKLSLEEKTQAFEEWSEGCPSLHEIFWACDEKGLHTLASCAGHENEEKDILLKNGTIEKTVLPPTPYVSIIIEKGQEKFMQQIFESIMSTKKDVTIRLNKTNNNTTLSIYPKMENRDEIFSLIAAAIKEPVKDLPYNKSFENFRNAYETNKNFLSGFSQNAKYSTLQNSINLTIEKAKAKIFNALFKILANRQKQLSEPQTPILTSAPLYSQTDSQKPKSWELDPIAKKEALQKLSELSETWRTEPQSQIIEKSTDERN